MSALAALAVTGRSVHSQNAVAPSASQDEVSEVIVTGSRIARRDYTANSPIVTVGEESLRSSAAVTMEQVLNRLPQFAPSSGATYVTPALVANANLRSLGINRSLILVDGHRMQPASADGSVDLNTIPAGMIENVEVITGGASAAYGSDAIAGVVNIKLKRRFQGLTVDFQHGGNMEGAFIQQAGDSRARAEDLNITLGSNFADDRGNATLSFNYTERNEVMRGATEFFKLSFTGTGNGYGVANFAANAPTQAAMNQVFGRYGAAAGAVGRTQTVSINPDGSLFNNAPGPQGPIVNYRGPLNETTGEGPYHTILNNNVSTSQGAGSTMWIPMKRYNVFVRSEYELMPNLNVYGQVSYVDNFVHWTSAHSGSGNTFPALLIPVGNPYIPADLRTLLASRANPNGDLTMNRSMVEVPRRGEENQYHVSQFEIGARGNLPVKDWSYEIYGSRGSNDLDQRQGPVPSISAVNTLLRAADGGVALCGGYNIFGYEGAGDPQISPACIAYITRYLNNRLTLEQDIVEASVTGTLFNAYSRDVKFALGADHRRQKYQLDPDFLLASGDVYGFSRVTPAGGAQSVNEVFSELLVPIVADVPLAKSVNLNLGYRFSKYNGLDGLNTYRADMDWTIIDPIRLRAGYARAARAPSLTDLYATSAGALAQIGVAVAGGQPQFSGDPCDVRGAYYRANPAAVRALCIAQGIPASVADTFIVDGSVTSGFVSGNPNLNPEVADTVSFGVVMRSPSEHPLLRGLSGSIDYYKIKIEDAVNPPSAQLTLGKCFNIDGSNPSYSNANLFCQNMVRNPIDGALGRINLPTLNLAQYDASGIDFQLDWGAGLGDLGLSDGWGRVGLSVVASYLDSFNVQTVPGAPALDFAGSTSNGIGTALTANAGGLPDLKVNVALTYSVGPAIAMLKLRHIAAMKDTSAVTNPASLIPGTPSYDYLDFNGRWRFGDKVEARLGVSNLTNKQPPMIGGSLGVTDQALFDVFGRQYYVGMRASF